MVIFVRYLLLYFIIILGSIFLADKTKRKLEICIILNLLIMAIITYLFGMIDKLSIGIWSISLINILLGIITIVKNIKQKSIRELSKNTFTSGWLFFTIIFFIFIVSTMNRELIHWDQYTYWSYAAKDMYYTENIVILSNNIEIQYPPMPTVLQVFFMKIVGEYSQGIEIFTTWILGYALLLPMFSKIKNTKYCKYSIVAIVMCIPAVFSQLIFFESSYPDTLLGLFIGFVTTMYFFEKDKKLRDILISLSIIFISLTKPSGFVIAGILVVTFLVYEIIKLKDDLKIRSLIKNREIRKIFIWLLIIIITYFSWQLIMTNRTMDIENTNKSALKTSEIIPYVSNSIVTTVFGDTRGDIEGAESIGNLVSKLYSTGQIGTPVVISAAGVMIIYILVLAFIYKYQQKEGKSKLKYLTISVFSGIILYTLFLELAYLTQFSVNQMLEHAGIERYIGTYLLGILYIIVFIVLNNLEKESKPNNIKYVILAIVIVMITPLNMISKVTITSGINKIQISQKYVEAKDRAESILELVDESSKILGLSQDEDKNIEKFIIRYYIYPIRYETIDKIKEKDNTDNYIEELINNKEYDYLYVHYIDNYLIQITGEYLVNEQIKENTLYKIEKEENKIKLMEVSK